MKKNILMFFVLVTFYSSFLFSQTNPVDQSFSVQLFQPNITPFGLWTVNSPRVIGKFNFSAQLFFNYQRDPLVIYECELDEAGDCSSLKRGNPRAKVIENHFEADVIGTISLFKRFLVGLIIPVNLYMEGEGVDPENGRGVGSLPNSVGLGDVHLILHGRILGGEENKDGVSLGVMVTTTFPTGNLIMEDSFMGDGFITVHPRLLVDFKWKDLILAANLGYMWREESKIFSTELGPKFTYGAGVSYTIKKNYRVIGEVFGGTGFSTDIALNSLEVDLGGEFRLGDFIIKVGGGPGIIAGAGVPLFRAFLGGGWVPVSIDTDNDGIADEKDFCMNTPEDKDGYQDEDGCPEPDNDGDGIPDEKDNCINTPEDKDEYQDEDGCPEPDNDGDEIEDGYDSCPNEPEDKDDYKDEDGCPDLDHDGDNILEPNDKCPDEPEDTDGFCDTDGCPEEDCDGDGIVDEKDECPDQVEDKDNFKDEDGCPEPDNDGDGIPDEKDKCPGNPENYNGVNDDDGCPDKGKTLVIITKERIEIKEQINFETGSAKIIGKRSFEILDIVAGILKNNPEINLRIEGHTDNVGPREYNLKLSQSRAEAVRDYLIAQGISGDRLTAVGYGPDRPIASNKTRKGRAMNRRVEFHIVTEITKETPHEE